jgi:hypothetical protein
LRSVVQVEHREDASDMGLESLVADDDSRAMSAFVSG